MSRNTKIVLGIVLGLVALCCVGAIILTIASGYFINQVAEGFVNDPEQSAEVAQSIVNYELPAGFTEQGAMELLGIKAAFMTTTDENSIIMLMEFPAAMQMNQEEMEQQMEQALSQRGNSQNFTLSPVSTEEVNINGQTVILSTSEGADDQGTEIRQVLGVFEGKSGNSAMLMIMGPINSWDEEGINSFIDSLQ